MMKTFRSSAPAAWLTLLAAIAVTACAGHNPFAYADTPEDKALVTLRSYDIVQEQVANLVSNPQIPDGARAELKSVDRAATAGLTELAGAFKEVQAARSDLAAGKTDEERLRIANANLVQWTATTNARIASVKKVLKDLKE